MGLTRKFLSVSSLGLISFRSRDERMEKFAKQTRNATRAAVAQRATGLELPRDQLAQAEVHHVDNRTDGAISGTPIAPPLYVPAPYVAPPGWYDARRARPECGT